MGTGVGGAGLWSSLMLRRCTPEGPGNGPPLPSRHTASPVTRYSSHEHPRQHPGITQSNLTVTTSRSTSKARLWSRDSAFRATWTGAPDSPSGASAVAAMIRAKSLAAVRSGRNATPDRRSPARHPRSRTHRPRGNPRPLRRPSRHPRAAPALRPTATTRTTRPRRTIRRPALADTPALDTPALPR